MNLSVSNLRIRLSEVFILDSVVVVDDPARVLTRARVRRRGVRGTRGYRQARAVHRCHYDTRRRFVATKVFTGVLWKQLRHLNLFLLQLSALVLSISD